MRIPSGFYYKDSDSHKDYVLRLKRNIYGLKQAAYNWFQLLTAGLQLAGFKQSECDPCLFIHPSVICVIYVDDTLLFAKTNSEIEAMIVKLQEMFELTDEGDVESFLGIQVIHRDNSIELNRPTLIDKVIETVGLQHDSKCHKTPTVNPPLTKKWYR